MKVEQLIANYPRLFHMAETGTWQGIKRHGLLSTAALLDLFQVNGARRSEIEETRRPECITITHPVHGRAVIRDQKPMTESALNKCLIPPMTPNQWCRILNAHTFFWLSEKRLTGLLGARAYRDRQHCVLTLDTARLVEAYGQHITLSPINSGSTIYTPQSRGEGTFRAIADFPFDQRRETRSIENVVVELLVRYAVVDIDRFVLKVDERKGSRIIQTIVNRC